MKSVQIFSWPGKLTARSKKKNKNEVFRFSFGRIALKFLSDSYNLHMDENEDRYLGTNIRERQDSREC